MKINTTRVKLHNKRLGGEILDKEILNKDRDKMLIEKTLKGDTNSFSILVQTYQPYLYNFLIRMTCSKEDTEEILQDAFIKVYKNLYKYNDKWPFSVWIYKITINTYKSHFKKKKKYYEQISNYQILENTYTDYGNPELSYELKEGYKEIIKMFNCLN